MGIFKNFNNWLGLPFIVFKRNRSLKCNMGNSLSLMIISCNFSTVHVLSHNTFDFVHIQVQLCITT